MKKSLPPKHLRGLPEDYVTKEIGDTERVHAADPAHIVRGLIKDRVAKEHTEVDQGNRALERTEKPLGGEFKYIPGVTPPLPITPYIVDILRMRTLISTARMLSQLVTRGVKLDLKEATAVQHMWFPHNRSTYMAVRPGLPPPDSQRPVWLKGIDLELDLCDWPQRIRNMLKERGVDCAPILAQLKKIRDGQIQRSPWLSP